MLHLIIKETNVLHFPFHYCTLFPDYFTCLLANVINIQVKLRIYR